jgi:Uma2 family endonuclease
MALVLIDEEPMALKDFICSKYHRDGGWELCKGELVAMSPARANHDAIVARLAMMFGNAVAGKACRVYGSNIGLRLWDDNSFLSPDLSICCDKSMIQDGWFIRVPELVVEVLSASTKAYCCEQKRGIYKEYGAIEYWMVDPEYKLVTIENFHSKRVYEFELGEYAVSEFFGSTQFEIRDIFDVLFDE